jgi:hypothetical protein
MDINNPIFKPFVIWGPNPINQEPQSPRMDDVMFEQFYPENVITHFEDEDDLHFDEVQDSLHLL